MAESRISKVIRPVQYPGKYENAEDAPTKKKTRMDSADHENKKEARSDSPPSGILRFAVEEVSKFGLRFSRKLEVGGVPWRARVEKEVGNDAVSIYLYSVGAYGSVPDWSIDLTLEYAILNADSAKDVVETHSTVETYSHGDTEGGCIFDDVTWTDLMNEKKGFIRDDTITFEIRFTIHNSSGIRTPPQVDFTDPNVRRHDVALTIGGEKIYVNKGILAEHSPFFNNMFYGDSSEYFKSDYELKDVTIDEFVEMLRVIYPSHKKITDDNVISLLVLGDRFQMNSILDLAENHLISCRGLKVSLKLLLSEQYRLFNLQDHCIAIIKTEKVMKSIERSTHYEYLPDEIKDKLRTVHDDMKNGTFIPYD